MDFIKIELQNLSRGHVRVINGVCVMRVADRYVAGETINIRSQGEDLDSAAKTIYELGRQS